MSGASPPERDAREIAWRRSYGMVLGLLGLTGLVLLLLMVAVGMWWRTLRTPEQARRVLLPPATAAAPLPVPVIRARITSAAGTLTLPALLLKPGRDGASSLPPVMAPVSGRLARWLAVPGTRVARGQSVAQIQTTSRVAAYRSAAGRQPHRPRAAPRLAAANPRLSRQLQGLQQQLARAERAAAAAEQRVAALQARRSAAPARSTSPAEIGEATAFLSSARADLAERDAALRESERLYRAGAASQAECRADAEARAAAAARLSRAEERVRTAQAVTAGPPAGEPPAPELSGARSELARARAELKTARRALRDRERLVAARLTGPPAPAPAAPTPPSTTGALAPSPSTSPRSFAPPGPRATGLTAVRAPATGVVTGAAVRRGTHVTRGQILLRLSGGGRPRYQAVGSEDRLGRVRVGMPVRLRLGRKRAAPARVSAVTRLPQSRRVRLDIVVPGWPAGRPLEPRAQVELPGPAAPAMLTVPARAVQQGAAESTAWVARRSFQGGVAPVWTAHRQRIELADIRRGVARVRRGLTPEDRVIIAGTGPLREGQVVSPVPWSLP